MYLYELILHWKCVAKHDKIWRNSDVVVWMGDNLLLQSE